MKFPKLDMRKYARRDVAIVLAALALLGGVVMGREKPAVELVLEKPSAPVVEDIDISRLQRPESAKPVADPFAQKSFAPAPQQQGAPQEAKPSVPPLPFKYLGKAIEDGKLEVFLARGEDSYSVRAGQKIGDEYRVDKVTEKAVTFTYLPMKTKQTLDIPEVQ
jgi:hypothetical protein